MVGKLSDDRLMSGSRIPVLYAWLIAKDGHPYSTPNDELRRSISAKHGEYTRDETHSEPAYMGNLFESAIVGDVCDYLGLPEAEMSPAVFTSPDKSWQCSLDGLVTLDAPITLFADDVLEIDDDLSSVTLVGQVPIECKTTEARFTGKTPLWRGPIQLQMQMMAVNARYGILATVHRGNQRHYKVYKSDPVMQQIIGDLCLDFQERVAEERFYPPVNVDDCSKTHLGGQTDAVELPSLTDRVDQLMKLREESKQIEAQIEALQTDIMCEMQDNEVAIVGEYTVKWPTRHYKAQPEKVTPAKDARTIRLKTLQIK
jgi:hypothetical protein